MCTAVCIHKEIFISAARCVYLLKIKYTSVLYQNQRLSVKALVLPSEETKQQYDDLGLIVVMEGFQGAWKTISLYNEKRTDNVFRWFEEIPVEENGFKVVGYVRDKGDDILETWDKDFALKEMEVSVGIQLCRDILPFNQRITGFNVPCYHSCTLEQFNIKHERCKNYHGVLGGALINIKTNTLFGIATWAAYFYEYELPVGFSVPNSNAFFEDFACAVKIKNSKETSITDKYYQKLCDNKRKKSVRKMWQDHRL